MTTRNFLLSGLLTFAITISSVIPAFAFIDEGMYMPDKIGAIAGCMVTEGRGLKPTSTFVGPYGTGTDDATTSPASRRDAAMVGRGFNP